MNIKNMKLGDRGYTVPWALEKRRKKYRLRESYGVEPEKHGTVSLRIERDEDGYRIGKYPWHIPAPLDKSQELVNEIRSIHQTLTDIRDLLTESRCHSFVRSGARVFCKHCGCAPLRKP